MKNLVSAVLLATAAIAAPAAAQACPPVQIAPEDGEKNPVGDVLPILPGDEGANNGVDEDIENAPPGRPSEILPE